MRVQCRNKDGGRESDDKCDSQQSKVNRARWTGHRAEKYREQWIGYLRSDKSGDIGR